jgi:hypothetical protein
MEILPFVANAIRDSLTGRLTSSDLLMSKSPSSRRLRRAFCLESRRDLVRAGRDVRFGGAMRFNLQVDSFADVLLGVMFGGFALALVDWLAEMLVMRPWLTGHMGGHWAPSPSEHCSTLSQPVW